MGLLDYMLFMMQLFCSWPKYLWMHLAHHIKRKKMLLRYFLLFICAKYTLVCGVDRASQTVIVDRSIRFNFARLVAVARLALVQCSTDNCIHNSL